MRVRRDFPRNVVRLEDVAVPAADVTRVSCRIWLMRGNGDSDGLMEDEYTATELADACAVIAWARVQPRCSGSVGMIGIS